MMRLTMARMIEDLREDLRIAIEFDNYAKACGSSSRVRRQEIHGRAILLANMLAASQRPASEPKP